MEGWGGREGWKGGRDRVDGGGWMGREGQMGGVADGEGMGRMERKGGQRGAVGENWGGGALFSFVIHKI